MYAVIIDGSLINPTVDVIEVSQEFLDKDLGESMFDEGIVDSEQEWIDATNEEKCEYFSFNTVAIHPTVVNGNGLMKSLKLNV